MSDRVFVDTNVFVYADDRSAKTKRRRRRSSDSLLSGPASELSGSIVWTS